MLSSSGSFPRATSVRDPLNKFSTTSLVRHSKSLDDPQASPSWMKVSRLRE